LKRKQPNKYSVYCFFFGVFQSQLRSILFHNFGWPANNNRIPSNWSIVVMLSTIADYLLVDWTHLLTPALSSVGAPHPTSGHLLPIRCGGGIYFVGRFPGVVRLHRPTPG